MMDLHRHASIFMELILVLFHVALSLQIKVTHGPKDYCTDDKFEPRCNDNEVVIIESAAYGRMEPGKCFPNGEGNFGCSADVMNILDAECSGRLSCIVSPIHSDLFATKPCGQFTVGYLSVSYSCVTVISAQERCTNGRELALSDINGYLSTNSPKDKFGTNCPLSINVPMGRPMKFTVYNFMKKSGSACYEIAIIKENDNQKSVHVCQSDPKTKEVMVTSTSHVTVHFSDFQIGDSVGGFLLYYEATGCPQPSIPQNAHLEREGDRVKVICNNTDKSWFIYCKVDKWTDPDRSCPEVADWGISKIFKTESSFPYGIFLTSFIGVGIGIFLGGLLLFLAINAFQRHQRRIRQAYGAPPVIPDPDYKIYDTSKMDFTLVPGFGTGGHHTIPRHQMSPPPVPSQPPEDDRRFSRHTYEKPKYNSTDNSPFVEA